jgi:hypothetical protein
MKGCPGGTSIARAPALESFSRRDEALGCCYGVVVPRSAKTYPSSDRVSTVVHEGKCAMRSCFIVVFVVLAALFVGAVAHGQSAAPVTVENLVGRHIADCQAVWDARRASAETRDANKRWFERWLRTLPPTDLALVLRLFNKLLRGETLASEDRVPRRGV